MCANVGPPTTTSPSILGAPIVETVQIARPASLLSRLLRRNFFRLTDPPAPSVHCSAPLAFDTCFMCWTNTVFGDSRKTRWTSCDQGTAF
jgi:hypothetical protein